MKIVFARSPRHTLVAALASILAAIVAVAAVPSSAEARGGRSYYRPSRGGTHAHYACEYGCSGRSRSAWAFGHRSRGFGDEHFGALGRRFRRTPDGVLYPVGFGVGEGEAAGAGSEVEGVVQPACVYDRVPEPPPGYTVFSRPPRSFEITGQPVAFSDEVPDRAGAFRLCE